MSWRVGIFVYNSGWHIPFYFVSLLGSGAVRDGNVLISGVEYFMHTFVPILVCLFVG